jgi:hypothetical protein
VKINKDTGTTKLARQQVAIASGDSGVEVLRALDVRCLELGTSRQQIAKALGLHSEVVRWAFLSGKRERATQVRLQVRRHLEQLARKQAAA